LSKLAADHALLSMEIALLSVVNSKKLDVVEIRLDTDTRE
jgi:hypothetical protein